MQLSLLDPNTEIDLLKLEIEKVKQSSENVRKGLFARHNELAKMYIEAKQEIEYLKGMMERSAAQ